MTGHNKYFFITYIEHYGGIETLVLRMLEWLKGKGKETCVIIDRDRKMDIQIYEEISNISDRVFMLPFRSYCAAARLKVLEIMADDQALIVTFTYAEYFLAQQIKHIYHQVDVLFYVPHQYGLIFEFNFENRIVKKIAHNYGKSLAKRMAKNHEIVHMDYLCAERLESEYKILQNTSPVIPLAMEIRPVDYNRIDSIFRNNDVQILTIARSEFPFKGYIFGLMDFFDDIASKNSNIHLQIISIGPDYQQLVEAYNQCKNKNKIQLIPGVAYKELKRYFDNAKIYIGMGTTLLDAANNSVLGFPTGSYTYDLKGYDYYFEDGMNLGGLKGEKDISDLIIEAISLSKDKYLDVIKKQHEEISRCYDIESVMNQIDSFRNSRKKGAMTVGELFFLNMIKRAISIRRSKDEKN